jgi:hypothetical protein
MEVIVYGVISLERLAVSLKKITEGYYAMAEFKIII